jgi:hypothetical protein
MLNGGEWLQTVMIFSPLQGRSFEWPGLWIPNSDQSRKRNRNYKSKNKWANMDPQTYWRWDQLPMRSKLPCLPVISTVTSVPLLWMLGYRMRGYPLSTTVYHVRFNCWYEKCLTTYGSMIVCIYRLDDCNYHRTFEKLTSKENVEIHVNLICLPVVYTYSKTVCMKIKPSHVDSVESYICNMLVIEGCCYK